MKLTYSIAGTNGDISAPAFGTPLIGPNGEPLPQGRYYLPNCNVVVDLDASGNVSTTLFVPTGGILEDDSKQSLDLDATPSVTEELFLKTVALLGDKEKLDKVI